MKVEILHTEGCPGLDATRAAVGRVLWRLAPGTEPVERLIADEAQARAEGFVGSPSVRIDGQDLEGRSGPATGLG